MTARRGRHALEPAGALRDLDGANPDEIRARVCETARVIAGASFGGFYTVREVGGELRHACPAGTDDHCMDQMQEHLSSVRWPTAVFDPRRPPDRAAHRFEAGLAMSPAFRAAMRAPLGRELFGPVRVVDQCRRYFYHGDHFLGWLGALAVGGDRAPFSRDDARALDSAGAALTSALVAAERLETSESPELGADFVVRGDGMIELASASATAWTTRAPAVVLELAHAVRALDRGEPTGAYAVLRGCAARWSRVSGPSGVRYLIHVAPAPPLRRDALHALTATQRAIVDCLVVGATVVEAARSLGVAEETARSHVKAVYQRLGIASRAELVRVALASRAPDESRR